MEKEERKEISFKKEEDAGNKGWVTDGGDEARKVVMNTTGLERVGRRDVDEKRLRGH